MMQPSVKKPIKLVLCLVADIVLLSIIVTSLFTLMISKRAKGGGTTFLLYVNAQQKSERRRYDVSIVC